MEQLNSNQIRAIVATVDSEHMYVLVAYREPDQSYTISLSKQRYNADTGSYRPAGIWSVSTARSEVKRLKTADAAISFAQMCGIEKIEFHVAQPGS